jgi:hypothetical protein
MIFGQPSRQRGRRALAGLAAAALATMGLVLAPHGAMAGSTGQPSATCTDSMGQEMEVPIMPNPVPGPFTLAVEIGTAGSIENIHFELCFSDNLPGTPSSLAGGYVGLEGPHLVSGPIPTGQVACANDSGVVFRAECTLGAAVIPTTGNCAGTCTEQVTVTIPYQICAGVVAGSHLVGSNACAFTTNGTGTIGQTGVIVTTLGIGPGPNGTMGITVAPDTQVWIDGAQLPLGGAAGAGVNPAAVGAGTGGTLACAGSLGCVPGAWVATSGAPLAWLSIPGVGALPINPPGAPSPECFSVGTTCPSPF